MTESTSTEEVAIQGYEIMFIVKPELGEQGTQEVLEQVRELIAKNGGKVTDEDVWGLRDLAYTIKKHDRGFYVVLDFTLEPSKLQAFNKPLNLNQEILRYLITKTPEGYSLKTIEEYNSDAEKEEAEAKKKKEESTKKQIVKKSVEKAKKAEVKEEKVEAPEAPVEKKTKEKIDEVDEKLKGIINDPDISL